MNSIYYFFYALKLKAEGLLDTGSYSLLKDVSENMFKEGEKILEKSLTCCHPIYTQNHFNTGVARGTGCFLPVNFKCLQTLDSEESREVHNRLVLDAQLKLIQPSQL